MYRYQGDYAYGDYHRMRGDPFLGKLVKGVGRALGTVARGAIGVAAQVLPGPLGMAARAVTRPTERVSFFPPEPSLAPLRSLGPNAVAYAEPGGGMMLLQKKRRRMNVANPKALRRAIRRSKGFLKLARKAVGPLGYSVQRRGGGPSRGVITRSEAARALRR